MNRTEAPSWRAAVAAVVVLLAIVCGASGQDSSLLGGDASGTGDGQPRLMTLREGSWPFMPPPEIKTVELHSIVSVLVDEKTMVLSEGEIDRKKKAHGELVLADWILLKGLSKVFPDPQSAGDPKIRAEMDSKNKAEGSMESRESMKLKIACHVVDKRPNGNLVLEGHRQIKVNQEVWDLSLTGEIRPEDVLANNSVLSESVANLSIHKREQGDIRNSYRNGWLLQFLDKYQP